MPSPACERGPRPTAVLLHGFLGSPADWQPIIKRLAGKVRCIAPALLEHPTLDALQDALRQATPAPAALIGYSMGARLALHLMVRDPHRYRAGILASGSPGLLTESERAQRRRDDALLAEQLRSIADTEALREFLDEWYGKEIFSGVRTHPCYDAMLERRLRIDPRSWADALAHFGTGALPSLWNKLGGLKQPTLALAGTRDRRYVAIARQMEEHAAAIHAHLLPDCSHAVLCCKPTEFAKQVVTFLDEELPSP